MTTKAEYTPTDSASRWPLLLLLMSGLVWLVVAGALSLLASLQLHSPGLLACYSFTTYGRMTAMAQTAFVYGWLANAGLALALWILGRLSGEPLRAQNWSHAGAVFWNLSVTGAIIGVAVGEGTGFDLLGLPRFVHLAMLFSYAAIAVSGLLAWSGRLRQVSYASHWYAAAALFLFPWIFSTAHIMLFSAPVRGVVQAIVSGWYGQCAWTLWLAPLALSVGYYVVPKVTGKTLPSYEFASLGFWCLILVGGLTGGRHLLGGPVPAWIPSVAVVSCALLLFHTCVVVLNLRGAFTGNGVALKFIAFGLAAYFVGAVADVLTSFHGIAVHTQFTFFDEAQKQLALYGAASTLLFGGIYYALPRITGRAWYSGGLVRAHLFLSVAGIVLLIASLTMASVAQSQELLEASVPFSDIVKNTRPWLAGASAAEAVLLLGSLVFLLNFYLTSCEILKVSKPAEFTPSASPEGHAP
jgi:cytochrome c oxidase cbb3-type subunit I